MDVKFLYPTDLKTRCYFVRFLLVGVGNVALTYAIYLAGLLVLSPGYSILLATAVGLFFTTLLSIRYTFSRAVRPLVAVVFLVYYVGYGLLTAWLVSIAVTEFMVPSGLAPLPVLCITAPAHFLCSRFIISGLSG